MDKLAKALLSMRAMAVGMFIFLSGIAVATFIESDQGIQAAKLWVYNALWFEILILFLTTVCGAVKRSQCFCFTFHLL